MVSDYIEIHSLLHMAGCCPQAYGILLSRALHRVICILRASEIKSVYLFRF